jgi:hypothetical protein
MFANRIRRFLIEEPAAPARATTGFAVVPGRALVGTAAGGPTPDIYRLAYEQAVQQVARRHQRQRRSHEWN